MLHKSISEKMETDQFCRKIRREAHMHMHNNESYNTKILESFGYANVADSVV